MGFEDKVFCVKTDKARIETRQETVNHELDEVQGSCGRAYIPWITDAATINSNACMIGIFLLRSDLTHNHGLENLFSSVFRDILNSNDAEGVCALHS